MNTAPELRRIFQDHGTRAALIYLNALTDQRFSSIFHFDGEMLHNLCLYDRNNPESQVLESIPVEASYCLYIRDTRCGFNVSDSLADERLSGHPKQPVVQSYCGVPIVTAEGEIFGTVCHFDFDPGAIHPVAVSLLEILAELIGKDPGAIGS